jgi:REP element-mobilizing transposase RayT
MRQRRLKAPDGAFSDTAYYHCVSRVVNRDFVFGTAEKEALVRLMRMYERFCGVRVVTFCVMSNHFHLLVGVPKKPEVMPSNAQLVTIVRESLGDLEATRLEDDLEQVAKAGAGAASVALAQAAVRERYLRRMWDISLFMKTLKQRFTQWFIKEHERKGTLWEDRFRSVLLESAWEPLRAMAAYIDLNPVRAQLVADPKDYRWSGYGAAMGGDAAALAGLQELERVEDAGVAADILEQRRAQRAERTPRQVKKQVLERHRVLLYGRGEQRGVGKDGRALRQGFTREAARQVVAEGGRLPGSEYLRCRVRYFTDGAVIGSRSYVNGVFGALRERFGATRKTGARLLRGLAREERLYALRDVKAGGVG